MVGRGFVGLVFQPDAVQTEEFLRHPLAALVLIAGAPAKLAECGDQVHAATGTSDPSGVPFPCPPRSAIGRARVGTPGGRRFIRWSEPWPATRPSRPRRARV